MCDSDKWQKHHCRVRTQETHKDKKNPRRIQAARNGTFGVRAAAESADGGVHHCDAVVKRNQNVRQSLNSVSESALHEY